MNRSLLLAVLLLSACTRSPPPAAKPACDRGEPSTPAAQRALVEDESRSPALRAARLRALFATEPASAEAMSALFSVLTAEATASRPMPLELVEVARALANRPSVQAKIVARIGALKSLAEQTRATPASSERALKLAGRIEDRAGRLFSVEPAYRPDPASIAPMQEGFPAARRNLDEVYDAWLSCRRAEPAAWAAVKRGVEGSLAERAALALPLRGMLEPMLDATAPESDAAKNALR